MSRKVLLLDDFEHDNITKYETNHSFVTSYHLSISNKFAKTGKNSLKISYHFGEWLKGNGAMYVLFKENIASSRRPVKFGLWVYGDGKSPWLRAVFMDGNGERKTVNLTKANIDWVGWRYVDAAIDQSWELPIKLEQIYAVETDKKLQGDASYAGEIYFDQLRFVYIDDEDLIGPIFTEVFPKEERVYQQTFTFSTKVVDDMSGVDPESIFVKVNGQRVPHHYCHKTGLISYPFKQVDEGVLHLVVTASDYAGNLSLPPIDKRLKVDVSPDIEPPKVTNITPTENVITYSNKPRITFNVIDEKSGVDKKDIIVRLDGEKLEVKYDKRSGWCYTFPTKKLLDGEHVFTITVKDRAGNRLDPIKRKINVQDIANEVEDTFSISVIPDTHCAQYTELLLKTVARDSAPIVIHMGDMVEEAKEKEFQRMKKNIHLLNDKKLLTVAGNHEAFQGNLDLYQHYFGSPTFHMEMNNTLIVVLNSAFEQSISQSDSTQFHYLNHVLAQTKAKNIVIATHVPTKDHYGTAHSLVDEDAEKLEQIVRDFKYQNQHVQIMVLFGHLHVLQTWKDEAQTHYIITGNGAKKGYVSHQNGNLLGYGVLDVTPDGMNYQFKPLLASVDIKVAPLKVNKGTRHLLHVYGYVNVLQSNYSVDLTNLDSIYKKWTSSDPNVITINDQGVIFGKERGTACIQVEVNEKKADVMIEVE